MAQILGHAEALRHDGRRRAAEVAQEGRRQGSPGELLAEVETDKAKMDFEAFDEGVLLKLLVADGARCRRGADRDHRQGRRGHRQAGRAGEGAARSGRRRSRPRPTPAKAGARARGAGARSEAGRGCDRRAAPKPAPAPAPMPTRAARAARRPHRAAAAAAAKVLASPLARRLATDLGIDLRGIQGTGPGGRIVERDVKAAAEGGANGARRRADWHAAEEAPQTSAPRVSAAAALPAQIVPERRSEARPAGAVPAEDIVKPLSMMRRTIAARLIEAKTTSRTST